jgi:uncharacterized membrane protein YsdA (DUF1294 family)
MTIMQIVLAVYLCWLAVINVITARYYIQDKRAARQSKWRVPERTLFKLNWWGGVVGAWLVFFLMRHKVRKSTFWIVQASATILHLILLCVIIYLISLSRA